MPPPPAQPMQPGSGGPPSSFWEKFSSMFGSSGQAPPPPQSGTQSGSQAGNSQAMTDSQSMMPTPSAPAQAPPPPPSWAYSPQGSGSDQAGCAPSAQSNQRKRGLGQYGPVHGGVSLSNIPYTETSMPFQSASENLPMSQMGDASNIPSMSFSINPAPPVASLPQQTLDPVRRLPMVAQPEAEPSYILARPSLSTPVQVSYPTRVEIPDQPYVYVDSGASAMIPAKNDRVYYVVDPLDSSRGYVQVSDPVQPAASLYRLSRGEKADELNTDEPVLLYSISKNGKTGKEIKKILLDPDNGLVISKSDADSSIRRKRSADADEDDKPDAEEDKDADKTEEGDPNGHSHSGNDQVLTIRLLDF